MRFLKSRGLDSDPNGALFFGENGQAMTTKTYARRFNALIPILIEQLAQRKHQGDLDAALDYDELVNQKMTPHAFRKFFSEYVARHENSAHILAMYRGDHSLQSALAYLRQAESKRKEIRAIQDSFAGNYEKLTGAKPF